MYKTNAPYEDSRAFAKAMVDFHGSQILIGVPSGHPKANGYYSMRLRHTVADFKGTIPYVIDGEEGKEGKEGNRRVLFIPARRYNERVFDLPVDFDNVWTGKPGAIEIEIEETPWIVAFSRAETDKEIRFISPELKVNLTVMEKTLKGLREFKGTFLF